MGETHDLTDTLRDLAAQHRTTTDDAQITIEPRHDTPDTREIDHVERSGIRSSWHTTVYVITTRDGDRIIIEDTHDTDDLSATHEVRDETGSVVTYDADAGHNQINTVRLEHDTSDDAAQPGTAGDA